MKVEEEERRAGWIKLNIIRGIVGGGGERRWRVEIGGRGRVKYRDEKMPQIHKTKMHSTTLLKKHHVVIAEIETIAAVVEIVQNNYK